LASAVFFLVTERFLLTRFFSGETAACWLLAQGGGAGGGGGDFLGGSTFLLPLVLTMVVMYLFLMRPEQKKRKEMEKLIASIKKNDHVVTVGGIYGTVVAAVADQPFVTVRVDDSNGTKLRILRSAISRVGADEMGDAKVGE
jgi:preprotein translocase subunit YajC